MRATAQSSGMERAGAATIWSHHQVQSRDTSRPSPGTNQGRSRTCRRCWQTRTTALTPAVPAYHYIEPDGSGTYVQNTGIVGPLCFYLAPDEPWTSTRPRVDRTNLNRDSRTANRLLTEAISRDCTGPVSTTRPQAESLTRHH